MYHHRVQEVVWVTNDIALDLSIILIFRVLVVIHVIHGLIMVLLDTSSLLNDNSLFPFFLSTIIFALVNIKLYVFIVSLLLNVVWNFILSLRVNIGRNIPLLLWGL